MAKNNMAEEDKVEAEAERQQVQISQPANPGINKNPGPPAQPQGDRTGTTTRRSPKLPSRLRNKMPTSPVLRQLHHKRRMRPCVRHLGVQRGFEASPAWGRELGMGGVVMATFNMSGWQRERLQG